MNKRISTLLLAVLMLTAMTACRSKKQETNQVSETYVVPAAETESAPPTPTPEPIPGIEINDFKEEDILFPADDTETPNTTPTDSTNDADNNGELPSTPAPTEAPSEPDTPDEPDVTAPPAAPVTEYEAYNAMSAEEQMAFYETFDSMADFVAWYNSVQAEHEATHGAIEVGDGNIDLSEIIHGQP